MKVNGGGLCPDHGCSSGRRECRGRCQTVIVAAVVLSLSAIVGCSRTATQAQPQKTIARAISYVGSWGMRGDEPGQLDQPVSIAIDRVGDVYIPDAGSYFVHKFDWRGTPLLSFQDPLLKNPGSIALDSGGGIYVTDSQRGSTFVFFPGGDRYRDLRLTTRPKPDDELGVAVADDGVVQVLDPDKSRVFTYNSHFRFTRSWSPAANSPNEKVGAGSIAAGPDGYVYIVDPEANRMLRFTEDGHFAGEFNAGANRRLSGRFAVTRGLIFAMDADGRKLHVWSTDGQPKLDVDLAPELGQANRPAPPIAISPRKEILVLDAPQARVLRYQINF
ncbi:MAG TPA: NHL repeat-containing protein [Candidatus Acidoferrales bacterium]